jgi:DNA-binding response OmpR family regulator
MGGRGVPGDRSAAVATERILIAEDDPAIADSVSYSLRACGYHVDVVDSGEAVLESRPGSYDLLILDVMLPGLSGVEVCRRVREQSAVPVLMLTALDSDTDRVVGLEAGADDYLGKPFSVDAGFNLVQATPGNRRSPAGRRRPLPPTGPGNEHAARDRHRRPVRPGDRAGR